MAQATKLFDLSAAASFAVTRNPAPSAPLAVPGQEPEQGPRKLVRPRLPEHLSRVPQAPRRLRGDAPLARHEGQAPSRANNAAAGSYAEALYFQKQMQTQTPMVFVLEDGEQIEGVVEWFDHDSIKVRNRARTLIFKRSIKYLYKAGGDTHA